MTICLRLFHFRSFFLMSALFFISAQNASASGAEDSIARALSSRHFNGSAADLQTLAGGQDELVQILLKLRTGSPRPFVSIRAERLLVELSDRNDVQAALLEDMSSTQAPGLARVITLQIDRAPTSEARQAIGRAALERSRRDPAFRSYTNELKRSADPSVRKLVSDSN